MLDSSIEISSRLYSELLLDFCAGEDLDRLCTSSDQSCHNRCHLFVGLAIELYCCENGFPKQQSLHSQHAGYKIIMLKSAKNNQMFASKSKARILLSKASFTGKSMALILLLSLASLDSTNSTSTIQQQRMPLSCSPEKKPSNPLPEGPVMQHMPHKTAHGLRTQIKDQQHQTLFPAGEAGQAGPFPSIGLKQASSMLATDSNFSLPSPSSDATHAIILNNSAGGDADEAGLVPSYDLHPPSSPMLLVGQSVCRETAFSGPPGQQPCAVGPLSVDSKCVKSCPQHCYEDTLQNFFF